MYILKLFNINILILIVFFLLTLNCESRSYKKYNKQSYSMGSVLEVTFFSYNKMTALKTLEDCFKLAEELENKISCKIEKSLISNLNNKKEMEINDEFVLNLIIDSVKFSKLTNGAFDPSLYNIIDLWGFETGNYRLPQDKEIKSELKRIGFNNIIIEKNTVKLKNNISLDFGAIGQGKIIGEISKFLDKNGIKDYLINGSGDIVIMGKYEGKRLWRVAIADPFVKNRLIGVIELTDCSIITSGDYERNFIGSDGKLYHHIFDPETGYPVNNGVHSVTIITDEPGKADALVTALFVMGEQKGLDFAKKNREIEIIYISGNKDNINISNTDNISKIEKSKNFWEFFLKK